MSYGRSNSLAPALLTAVVTFGLAALLWGIFEDGFVRAVETQPVWTDDATWAPLAREYVLLSWKWLLLPVLLRLGLELLVASRGTGGSGALVVSTVFLLFLHLILIYWAFSFPEMVIQMVDVGKSSGVLAPAGFEKPLDWAHKIGVAYVPMLFALGGDVLYIIGPIQRDAYGGVR